MSQICLPNYLSLAVEINQSLIESVQYIAGHTYIQ